MQGLTVDNAVVSLKKIFAPGQAYVAQSRVCDVCCDEKNQIAMSKMPQFIEVECNSAPVCQTFKTVLHNIQSLKAHIKDLFADDRLIKSNCIYLTETWLHADDPVCPLQIPEFVFYHRPRNSSYDNRNNMFFQLKQQSGSGIGAYCRADVKTEMRYPFCNNECLLIKFPENNLNVTLLYRPSTYPVSIFSRNLTHLINDLEIEDGGKIIMGDFNNILSYSSVLKIMCKHGYRQHVLNIPTENGTLMDHVYMKSVQNIDIAIMPLQFSQCNFLNIF